MVFTVPAAAGRDEQAGVNWDAYTHDELYRMVWDQADVAEVGAIAEEWRRHSAELAEQAARLREQQAALREHWQGESAELAAVRLGELADRVDGISARAAANQRAAQQAGEALALARASVPPPPGAPPATSDPFPFAGAPVTASPFALPSAPSPFELPTQPAQFAIPTAPAPVAPPGGSGFFMVFGAPPTGGTGMTPAFGSVATSGTSMYFGDVAANQAKAQAVQAMRVYESSLRGGESLVAVPGEVGGRTYGVAGSGPAHTPRGSGAPAHGGVPWEQLAQREQQHQQGQPGGRAPLGAGARLTTAAPPALPGLVTPADAGASAGRAAGPAGGMAPQAGRPGGGSEDETHENRMPVLDHGIFAVDVRICAPVIGADTTGADL